MGGSCSALDPLKVMIFLGSAKNVWDMGVDEDLLRDKSSVQTESCGSFLTFDLLCKKRNRTVKSILIRCSWTA